MSNVSNLKGIIRIITLIVFLTMAAGTIPLTGNSGKALAASYKNAVVGKWKIDEALTMKVNNTSMTRIFGTSYSYGNGMEISGDSSFSYYVAAGNGGAGTWNVKASNLYYDIIRYEDQTRETGKIKISHYDNGDLLLIMTLYDEFILCWKKAGSSKAATAKPKKAALSKVASPEKGTLRLDWKRDKTASGYQAMAATDKKFTKNKKSATIKSNQTTAKSFKKLKSNKVYYARVRAYKKIGKKKIYGAYSKVMKAKVK